MGLDFIKMFLFLHIKISFFKIKISRWLVNQDYVRNKLNNSLKNKNLYKKI